MVSACLCGLQCRFDGRSKPDYRFRKLLAQGHCLPFCPEQLGGLSTPREPAEIHGGNGFDVLEGKVRVVLRDEPGDVTRQFIRGAEQSVIIASLVRPDVIFLKERSPSCGVYDGDFCPGVAAAALILAGFSVKAADE